MRVLLVLLAALCAVLGAAAFVLFEQNRQHVEQINLLKAQGSSSRVSLEDQSKCDTHAAKLFKDLGYKENAPGIGFQSYTSHYDVSRAKCFALIETSSFDAAAINTRTLYLFDAVERRAYGDFMWVSSTTKKYWEVKPMLCRTYPSVAVEEFCDSEDQFKGFVAKYME